MAGTRSPGSPVSSEWRFPLVDPLTATAEDPHAFFTLTVEDVHSFSMCELGYPTMSGYLRQQLAQRDEQPAAHTQPEEPRYVNYGQAIWSRMPRNS